MAKATIENIYGIKPITKDEKTTYSYSVKLSDGTKGTIGFVSSNTEYKVGDEIEFTVKINGEYTNIIINKPKKPWSGGGAAKDYAKEKIISSMECAVNLLKHRGTKDVETSIETVADKILKRYTDKGL